MQNHQFFKAAGTASHSPETVTILLDGEFPQIGTDRDWQQRTFDLHRQQGDDFERVLFNTLPGGTYDSLLRAMLLRRASLLRVPWIPKESSDNLPVDPTVRRAEERVESRLARP